MRRTTGKNNAFKRYEMILLFLKMKIAAYSYLLQALVDDPIRYDVNSDDESERGGQENNPTASLPSSKGILRRNREKNNKHLKMSGTVKIGFDKTLKCGKLIPQFGCISWRKFIAKSPPFISTHTIRPAFVFIIGVRQMLYFVFYCSLWQIR